MFVTHSALPHLLKTEDYSSSSRYQMERQSLLLKTWHPVGTTSELATSGDFLTCEIAGVPVHLRNFDGRIRALSNVCAHRHCLITSEPCGRSEKMRCQYHGWEYQCDGRTGRIPEPKNFVPFDREKIRLPEYRLEIIGKLIFVSIDPNGLSIEEQLGNDFIELLGKRFGNDWDLYLKWHPEYKANWKIPIENSLEAYHVPAVHPNTFRVDPGEQKSEHLIMENRTAFTTSLPFSSHTKFDLMFQRLQGSILRLLGKEITKQYWQHHVFPNLLFSFTDAISLCHCIMPTGPNASRAIVREFGISSSAGGPRKLLARVWGNLEATIIRRILNEDMALFASIQKGFENSPHDGVLGRCEERIHAFQKYMQNRTSHSMGT